MQIYYPISYMLAVFSYTKTSGVKKQGPVAVQKHHGQYTLMYVVPVRDKTNYGMYI